MILDRGIKRKVEWPKVKCQRTKLLTIWVFEYQALKA